MKKGLIAMLVTLAVGGLAALASGCTPSVPATPTPTAPASAETARETPALAFDKVHVDLGTVARDQEGIQTFLAMNRGDRPLRVGPLNIQVQQGCAEVETVEGSDEIQPGEVVALPVKLGPHRELGPHHILVDVPSDDPTRPLATLSLRFVVAENELPSVAGPRLRVDKEIIDIGTVPFDWPLFEQFTLRNDGDAPLILDGTPKARVEEGC